MCTPCALVVTSVLFSLLMWARHLHNAERNSLRGCLLASGAQPRPPTSCDAGVILCCSSCCWHSLRRLLILVAEAGCDTFTPSPGPRPSARIHLRTAGQPRASPTHTHQRGRCRATNHGGAHYSSAGGASTGTTGASTPIASSAARRAQRHMYPGRRRHAAGRTLLQHCLQKHIRGESIAKICDRDGRLRTMGSRLRNSAPLRQQPRLCALAPHRCARVRVRAPHAASAPALRRPHSKTRTR